MNFSSCNSYFLLVISYGAYSCSSIFFPIKLPNGLYIFFKVFGKPGIGPISFFLHGTLLIYISSLFISLCSLFLFGWYILGFEQELWLFTFDLFISIKVFHENNLPSSPVYMNLQIQLYKLFCLKNFCNFILCSTFSAKKLFQLEDFSIWMDPCFWFY